MNKIYKTNINAYNFGSIRPIGMKWVSLERSKVILSDRSKIKMSNSIFFIENYQFLKVHAIKCRINRTMDPSDLVK